NCRTGFVLHEAEAYSRHQPVEVSLQWDDPSGERAEEEVLGYCAGFVLSSLSAAPLPLAAFQCWGNISGDNSFIQKAQDTPMYSPFYFRDFYLSSTTPPQGA